MQPVLRELQKFTSAAHGRVDLCVSAVHGEGNAVDVVLNAVEGRISALLLLAKIMSCQKLFWLIEKNLCQSLGESAQLCCTLTERKCFGQKSGIPQAHQGCLGVKLGPQSLIPIGLVSIHSPCT